MPEDFVRKPVAEKTKIVNLAPGDSIELSVEVDGRMEVSGHRAELNYTGIVTLPLVGDVKIGNMTLSKARGAIAKTYGVYFVNTPVIMISRVDDAAVGEWGFVTVTGRVSKPGRVKIPSAKGLKLTAVIQEAGGFSASAKKSAIRISRTDKNGRKIQVEVDFGEIGRNGNLKADIDLMDGDSVYIPERIF
ncbi:MAG: SLBB domain-containing protein [Kiritimatiellaceae bacterium]|nr:SLBB domain-containing protein [Kiritimatiellaceae bacterium]